MKVGDVLMKRLLSVWVAAIFLLVAIGTTVYADSVSQITNSVGQIVNAVSYIGYAVAMAMLIFVGIKYAMSPANEKADVKAGLVGYLIGALLIICASTIATLFVDIAAGEGADAEGLASDIISKATEL